MPTPARSADETLDVFVIAGEASGDVLGGALMQALRDMTDRPVRFSGVGGPAMAGAGLDSLFDYSELSLMGLVEILPHVPRLLRRIREVARTIDNARPDVLITIDSPGFVFAVIRRLHGRTFPRIHYVAPTVWAWRPGRVHKFRQHFDHLLALLPFEPPWFEKAGLPCTFVGHPIVEAPRVTADDKRAFRTAHGVADDATLLCVLPGSRRGELDRHLTAFAETVGRLAADRPGLTVVMPTLPHLATRLQAETAGWPVPVAVVADIAGHAPAMAASDAALAASGTVTLELARERVPTIVAYRVAPLTAWLVRRMASVRFVSIVNLIADRMVLPEYLQQFMKPAAMAAEIAALLDEPARRETMREAQDTAMQALGEGGPAPSRRAAQAVLDVVADWRKTRPVHS